MQHSPGTGLVEYLEQSAEEFSLSRGALLLAREDYPTLDIEHYLGRFAELARPLVARGVGALPTAETEQQLSVAFFNELGFRGNHTDYYDLRNAE